VRTLTCKVRSIDHEQRQGQYSGHSSNKVLDILSLLDQEQMSLMVEGSSVDQGHQGHQQRGHADVGSNADTKTQQQDRDTCLQNTKSKPMHVQTLIVELGETTHLLELEPPWIVVREHSEATEAGEEATLLIRGGW